MSLYTNIHKMYPSPWGWTLKVQRSISNQDFIAWNSGNLTTRWNFFYVSFRKMYHFLNYINVFFEAKGCDVSTWFRKRQCIYVCADVYLYCWEKVVVKSSQGLTLREGPLCVKCKMRLKKNAPPTSMRPLKHRGEGDNCFVKHYMKLDFYCFSQGHW